MKKWLSLFAICGSTLAFTLPIHDYRIDPTALSELSSYLNIPPESNLIEETQKKWLRKLHQERWELQELSLEQRDFILSWASKQGLFAELRPIDPSYDVALILGATTGHMQMRLDFLKKLWEDGIRFKKIIWLTGERPLTPQIDKLLDRCSNESEAASLIWEETDLPEAMRELPTLFVSVPMKTENNSPVRPNTKDTIITWLDQNPAPCKALFISTQPFCGYQFAVLKSALPETFLFDIAGPETDPSSHPAAAAITLDSIARWLYQDSLP